MGVAVLGPVHVVTDDGAVVPVPSRRQRLLLGLLAAAGGRVVSPDEIAEGLWGDAQPEHPAAAVQSLVSRLRCRLGPAGSWIVTEPAGYRFPPHPERLDAAAFEALLGRATADRDPPRPREALAVLDRALALWRGRAYADLDDLTAVAAEATRLDQLRADAAEARADALLALGRRREAATALAALTREHPFRERPVVLLVRALAADGRQAEALEELRRFRQLLDDELGLEPSAALRAVESDVLHQRDPAGASVGEPGNSFVGRDAEVARIAGLLRRGRLVTLTGPGGVGKTRLALRVASEAARSRPDGVHLCELADVAEPRRVLAALASSLGVEERADRPLRTGVVEVLRPRRTLLLLDNCEHVLPAVAALVGHVLRHTPDVHVLATSRERLGVEGELRVIVEPLPTSGSDDGLSPSAALFLDRVRDAGERLAPDAESRGVVEEICRRLDGLPLAIELAAAQTVWRAPAEILAALGRAGDLHDPHRTVQRHRSLDAVVDWSVALLPPPQRVVLSRLSVFSGGWSAPAAAAVAGAGDADLGSLVERSLVRTRPGTGSRRFSLLEPVRQYAEERLLRSGSAPRIRARHADWAVGLAERADEGLRGPDEAAWRDTLGVELGNLRAAHRWCLDSDPAAAVRLAASLYRWMWGAAPGEVYGWAEPVLDRHGNACPDRLPAAYAAAALAAWHRGDLARAADLARTGTVVARSPEAARSAWEALGDVQTFLGEFDQAVESFTRAADLASRAGDAHAAAVALLDRSLCHAYAGRLDRALADCAAADPVVQALGNPSLHAWADYANGEVRLDSAPADALGYLRRSTATARRVGNQLIVGVAGLSAASCEGRHGDPGRALAGYAELVEHWRRDGAWQMQWATLRTLVDLLARVGRDGEAARLFGAMGASASAPPLAGADAGRVAEAVGALRRRLGEARFERLCGEGAALGDEGAVALALATCGGGQPGRARPTAR